MQKQVLFVQGGGAGVHDDWDNKLVASLSQALGGQYEVQYPYMPKEADSSYANWTPTILTAIDALDHGAILVGHSVGATILISVLADHGLRRTPSGVFLIAAPFAGPDGWPSEDIESMSELGLRLPSDMPIHLYHGTADAIVPFSHLGLYAKAIPQAMMHPLKGRDHQLNDDMTEVAHDIEWPRRSSKPSV